MRRVFVAIGAVLLGSAPAAVHARTYLLSIVGIPFTGQQYIDHFKVQTIGVSFLAACQIPPDWQITLGGGSVEGSIEGQAGHGASSLSRNQLNYLHGIALVSFDGSVRRRATGTLPVTFAGKASLGTYGSKNDGPTRQLNYGNSLLTPASRCPPPRWH